MAPGVCSIRLARISSRAESGSPFKPNLLSASKREPPSQEVSSGSLRQRAVFNVFASAARSQSMSESGWGMAVQSSFFSASFG